MYAGSGTGDPHYWTVDRVYHTFNGRGDFTSLEIRNDNGTIDFALQGRLGNVRQWRITTHQGIAFGNDELAFRVSYLKYQTYKVHEYKLMLIETAYYFITDVHNRACTFLYGLSIITYNKIE